MFRRQIILLSLFCCICGTGLMSQTAGKLSGFWLNVGAGGGWNEGIRGASLVLRMGGTPHESVQFGVQVLRWWRVQRFAVCGRTSLGITGQYFPMTPGRSRKSPFKNWHLRAGFGVANVDHFMSGVSLNLGTGVDLGMDGWFFITPSVDLLAQYYQQSTNYALLLTVGLSWH